jgi:DNA polymerase III delta prime subunit
MAKDIFTQFSHLTLIESKKNNRLSHAYLIECSEEIYHEEIAKEIAKLILCESKHDEYNVCLTCEAINTGNSTEFEIVKPEGLGFKINQIRSMQSKMNKKAIVNNSKVYAIIEADNMSVQATNSLLKFVEEPLENLYGIFLVKNIYKFPRTLRSRCILLKYNIKEDKIISNLGEAEKFVLEFEKDKMSTIAKTSLYNLKYEKKEIKDFLDNLLEIYRCSLKDNNSEINEETKNILKKIEKIGIQKRMLVINKCLDRVNSNANINMLIDSLIIELGEVI